VVTLIRRVGPPIVVALIAFGAARAAMLPGLAFWDTGELQAVGPLMGTGHPAGFPTWVLLGWVAAMVLQPFGDPAFRMNLLAGLCLAAAAGITVDLVRALTRSTLIGILAGLGLALTPVAWAIGTHAETHALHLALLALILRLLVGWQARVESVSGRGADRVLVAAAVVFGLSIGNHSLTLLMALPVALFVHAIDREAWRNRRLVALCIGALAASVVLVHLELPLRAGPFRAALVYGRPETWEGFWYVTLGEQFRGSLIDPFGDLAGKVGSLVDRSAAQFGLLAPLLPVALAVTIARRPRYALLTGSAVLLTCFFAASYQNADIGRYYLGPVLMAWTWLAILGVEAADAGRRAVDWLAGEDPPLAADDPTADDPTADGGRSDVGRERPGQPGGRRAALAAVWLVALVTPTLLAAPDRFAALDESKDDSAVVWVDRALSVMAPDAVVVSWWSYSTPLWYAQRVEGRRPDLAIIDDRTRLDEGLGELTDVIDAHLGRDPVYVIRDDPDEIEMLAERYELELIDGPDARSLTRVIGLRGADS
jgi:transmembrane protein TMEM260 (protein O-mannosyltransferase)